MDTPASVPSEPSDDAYDVIVVGSGLGGVSAAAFLAKAGKKVLLAERQEGPGGYARAFRRGPYIFDPAVHVIGLAKEGMVLDVLLRLLGVRDRCDLLPLDHSYAAHFPDADLIVPAGFEEFVDYHGRRFRADAEGFRRLADLCRRMTAESQQLPPRLGLRELDAASKRFPTLFTYRSATLADVLDEHLIDPRAKGAAAATWPYVGLPPSRASFYTWGAMMMSLLEAGPSYCRGSFQCLVDAFVAGLERDGGELVVGNGASRIVVEDGKVNGVVLESGRRVRAPAVVSNADAKLTLERLVGLEHLPERFVRRLQRLEPSLSAFVVYTATGLDLAELGAAHETFVHRHWDHDRTYQNILDGTPGGIWASVPTLADPSLAPEGEHLIIFSALARYDGGWDTRKDRFEEELLGEMDALFPGSRDRLTYVESATPVTLERYTLNHEGATYGWANTPTQAVAQRLTHVTPVAGLYLAGHWTQPGASSFRVIFSGLEAAQLVLGYAHVGELMDALQG